MKKLFAKLKHLFLNRNKNTFIIRQDFMTLTQASEYLQLSKNQIIVLIATKEFPYYEPIKNEIRLKKSDLDRWIQSAQVGYFSPGSTIG